MPYLQTYFRTNIQLSKSCQDFLMLYFDKSHKQRNHAICGINLLVRVMGLEPIRHSTHAPQTCLSAYSSTLASQRLNYYITSIQTCQAFF